MLQQDTGSQVLRGFISYAHSDEEDFAVLLQELNKVRQFGAYKLEPWTDKRIAAGQNFNDVIRENISNCQIAILLLSNSFLNSEYIHQKEIPEIVQNQESKLILGIHFGRCDLDDFPFLEGIQIIKFNYDDYTTEFSRKNELTYKAIIQTCRYKGELRHNDDYDAVHIYLKKQITFAISAYLQKMNKVAEIQVSADQKSSNTNQSTIKEFVSTKVSETTTEFNKTGINALGEDKINMSNPIKEVTEVNSNKGQTVNEVNTKNFDHLVELKAKAEQYKLAGDYKACMATLDEMQNIDMADGRLDDTWIISTKSYCFIQLGTWDEAIQFYESIKIHEYKDEFNLSAAAFAYYFTNQTEMAMTYFKMAVDVNPMSEHGLNGMGMCHQKLGQYGPALEYYEKALQQIDDPNIKFSKAECLRKLSRFEEALVVLKELYDPQNETFPITYELGINSVGLGNYLEGAKWLEIAYRLNPAFPDCTRNLGYCYQKLEQYQRAVDLYLAVEATNPGDPWTMDALGWCLQWLENYSLALKYHLATLESDPENLTYLINTAFSYKKLNDADNAIKYYQKAIEKDPVYDWAINEIGLCFQLKNDFNKALDFFTRAYELKKDNVDYILNIGYAYEQISEYQKAIEFYTISFNFPPVSEWTYKQLGTCYQLQSDFNKSIEMFTIANTMNPTDPFYLSSIGYGYGQLGDPAKAFEYYKQAEAQDPEYEWVINQLGLIALDENRITDAVAYFEKLHSKHPQTSTYIINLSWSYFIDGKIELAREIINKYQTEDEYVFNYCISNGHILTAEKKLDEAKKMYLKAAKNTEDWSEFSDVFTNDRQYLLKYSSEAELDALVDSIKIFWDNLQAVK